MRSCAHATVASVRSCNSLKKEKKKCEVTEKNSAEMRIQLHEAPGGVLPPTRTPLRDRMPTVVVECDFFSGADVADGRIRREEDGLYNPNVAADLWATSSSAPSSKGLCSPALRASVWNAASPPRSQSFTYASIASPMSFNDRVQNCSAQT